MMPTDTDIAWAAGFFDGEGSVGIYHRIQYHRGKRYVGWRVVARVAGCHEGSIERFASIVGCGVVEREKRVTKRGRPIWRWCVFDSHVANTLRPLLPFLTVKKDQVELAIEFRGTVGNFGGAGTPTEITSRQSEMAARMKTLKLVS